MITVRKVFPCPIVVLAFNMVKIDLYREKLREWLIKIVNKNYLLLAVEFESVVVDLDARSSGYNLSPDYLISRVVFFAKELINLAIELRIHVLVVRKYIPEELVKAVVREVFTPPYCNGNCKTLPYHHVTCEKFHFPIHLIEWVPPVFGGNLSVDGQIGKAIRYFNAYGAKLVPRQVLLLHRDETLELLPSSPYKHTYIEPSMWNSMRKLDHKTRY